MIKTFKERQTVWTYIYDQGASAGRTYMIRTVNTIEGISKRTDSEPNLLVDVIKETRFAQCKYLGRKPGERYHRILGQLKYPDGHVEYTGDVMMRDLEHIFSSKQELLMYLSDMFVGALRVLENSETYTSEVIKDDSKKEDPRGAESQVERGIDADTRELLERAIENGHATGVYDGGEIREPREEDGIQVSVADLSNDGNRVPLEWEDRDGDRYVDLSGAGPREGEYARNVRPATVEPDGTIRGR